jgi:hypothetical protein
MSNEQERGGSIALISRGDIVRALRQHLVDIGITKDDIREMIRTAVSQAATERMQQINADSAIQSAAEKFIKKESYDIRKDIAEKIASRVTIKIE